MVAISVVSIDEVIQEKPQEEKEEKDKKEEKDVTRSLNSIRLDCRSRERANQSKITNDDSA